MQPPITMKHAEHIAELPFAQLSFIVRRHVLAGDLSEDALVMYLRYAAVTKGANPAEYPVLSLLRSWGETTWPVADTTQLAILRVVLERLIAIGPELGWCHHILAQVLRRQGFGHDAIEHLKRSVELSPPTPSPGRARCSLS